ncbi:MAG: hypothetical protein AMXMBFR64_36580 [Myxococcales bacterium]
MNTRRVWLLCVIFVAAGCAGAGGNTGDSGPVAGIDTVNADGAAGDAVGPTPDVLGDSTTPPDSVADATPDTVADTTPDAADSTGDDTTDGGGDASPDTGKPVYVACSSCGSEDECRGKPCETDGEECSVAPYCDPWFGECVCKDGEWACTSTDCPLDCPGPTPACCTNGQTVAAECTPVDWDCGQGTLGACPGTCGGQPPMEWCLSTCIGRAIIPPECTDELGWHCPGESLAPGECCDAPLVYTVGGCLTCGDAIAGMQASIAAAVAAHADCTVDADCTAVFADTACQGACQVPVSKAGEADLLAAIKNASTAYCQDYVQQCGYATPDCAPVTPYCKEGACALEWNLP